MKLYLPGLKAGICGTLADCLGRGTRVDGVCDLVIRREVPPLILVLLRSSSVSVEVTRYLDPIPHTSKDDPGFSSMVSGRREHVFRGRYDLTDLYQDMFERRLGEDALIRTTQGRLFARTVAVGKRAIDILFVRALGDAPNASAYEFTPQDLKVSVVCSRQFGAGVEYDSGDGSADELSDTVAEDNEEGIEDSDSYVSSS